MGIFGKKNIGRGGQVTLFVIIAIVIVVGGLTVYLLRDNMKTVSMPDSIEPVYTKFIDCLEEDVINGVSILQTNGGYIELPDFEPGSRYQPFSSYLTFAGIEIPYWSYPSGANILKTQVPSVEDMQKDLENYIDSKISYCSFREFEDQGFLVDVEDPISQVKISEDYIDVDLNMPISMSKGTDVSYISSHELRINSKLGFLHNKALSIYEKEQDDFFLEDYTLDVLRTYAPVDGVELSCSPKVWSADNVYIDLKEALESNTIMLTNIGRSDDYFTVDLNDDAEVNFVYSSSWPTYMEVNPTEGNVLVATPVGNQQGLGMLGFCYVPYHFVYNFRHPLLVQVSDSGETFQFPMTVLIEGNVPRKSRAIESGVPIIENICKDANTGVVVSVYDDDLNSVDASVNFECFGSSCSMGDTQDGKLSTLFPQCVNGIVTVEAEGYKKSKNVFSTVERGNLVVIMDREYELDIEVLALGKGYDGNAMITFTSDDVLETVVYPEVDSVKLSSGEYDVRVQLFSDSEIALPATTQEYCVDVPRSGLLGLTGLTQKQCNSVEVEEQVLTSAITGGGFLDVSLNTFDLDNSDTIVINVNNYKEPKSLEDLQENYVLVEVSELEVEFR